MNSITRQVNKEKIQEVLNNVADARDKYTCKQIDAGACQTDFDYRKRREAEEAFYTTMDEAEETLLSMMEEGGR